MPQGKPDNDAFMQALAARVGAPLGLAAHADDFAGRRVGPYLLRREIGRGGMGAVYLAERADQQFEKEVAVKVLPLGLENAEARERFDAERRILARLEHPGIARLLDGGVTDEGSPFFVMEYVEGTPITDYCQTHSLPLAARLRLFAQVCDAVDYAHRRLVVHRDLKPGNILVSTAGDPKLLDFGIAKLEQPEHATTPSSLTARAGLPLTLAYASPEQVRGEVVTTATDVYSLGLLLFELLTGQQARHLTGNLEQDLVQVVDATIPPMSSFARGHGIDPRRLRGDLDTIVAMAVRSEPTRRYRSVAALGDDIRRYLGGYPVAARPDTWRYRAHKAARRHPALVGAGIVAGLGIIAFISVLTAGTRRIAAERDLADRERARAEAALGRAEQVTRFLNGLFESADPRQSLGASVTARELLDRGLARADELASSPAAQAELLSVLAGVHYSLGMREQAADIAERALSIRERHFGDLHLDVAQSLLQLGTMEVPRVYSGASLGYLERALRIRQRLLGSSDLAVAEAAVALATEVRRLQADVDSSTALTRYALDIQRRAVGDSSALLIPTLAMLSNSLQGIGAISDADSVTRWRLRIRELHARTPLERASIHVDRAALLQRAYAPLSQVAAEVDRALALERPILGDHPQVIRNLLFAARVRANLGERGAARALYEDALAISERIGGQHTVRQQFASHLLQEGDAARAMELLERDIAEYAAYAAPAPYPLFRALAVAQLLAGQPTRAAESAREYVARLTAVQQRLNTSRGPYSSFTLTWTESQLWLGLTAIAAGNPERGAPVLEGVIEVLRQFLAAPSDSFYLPSGQRKTVVARTAADSLQETKERESQRRFSEFNLGLAEAGLSATARRPGADGTADSLRSQGLARMAAAITAMERIHGPHGTALSLRVNERALLHGVLAPPRATTR
jgi:eukaryotic-like serine/threonine-protein kinase